MVVPRQYDRWNEENGQRWIAAGQYPDVLGCLYGAGITEYRVECNVKREKAEHGRTVELIRMGRPLTSPLIIALGSANHPSES